MTTGHQIVGQKFYRMRAPRAERITHALSAANLLLALNFLIAVPFTGWLSYGHGGRLVDLIPDAVVLLILPAAYALYWHFWFAVAIPALFGAIYLYVRTGRRTAQNLVLANAVAIAAFWVTRVAFLLLDIHPDIV